jgi:NAD(P)-dependent dehydrogenase (short-subunit alcohol dehydrogenase family)
VRVKTVLVTGSSSGIGAATVSRFGANGWNVVATMRDPARGPWQPSETRLVTRLDVLEPDSITEALVSGLERFGRIDAVVNNAGYGQYGIFEAVSPDQVRQQLEVNLLGPMAVMRTVLPHFRASGGGVIVNVSSGAGLYGLPMASVYCASKFALEGFSEAVSYELRGVGIAVKLVIPHGGVGDTNFGQASGLPAVPDAYNQYATASRAAAARQPQPVPVPAETVAAVIFDAATDDTDRLRYLVGNDTRGLIAAWELPLEQREQRMRELLT